MREAAATALSNREFGTGLRARLDVERARKREAEYLAPVLELRRAARRDLSPELALVSPDFSFGGLELDAGAALEAPLGALLAEAGLLEDAQLEFALAYARQHGRRLGEVLVEQGLVPPAEVLRLVAAQHGLPFVDVRDIPVDPAAARLLPAELARDSRALPVGFARGLPVVAVADPTDRGGMRGARSILNSARFIASPEDAILYQLAKVYVGLGLRGN